MNRRTDHFEELTRRLAYRYLEAHTLSEAEPLGFAPYDFKLAHDELVKHGYEPLPHLSDQAYSAAMDERKNVT